MTVQTPAAKSLASTAPAQYQVNESSADLAVGIAQSSDEIRASQRLRYQIFAEELGATLKCDEPGLDTDPYDPYCRHLIVHDRANNRIAASTRILFDTEARLAGGFYSSTEFDLAPLLRNGGRVMEIGRTCVHPAYRNGAAISMLWTGLARCIDIAKFDWMIGCASIPMYDGGAGALAAYAALSGKYLIAEELRATPRLRIPRRDFTAVAPLLPPLLKAYMRLGAKICGEPCWDPAFNCADLLIALRPGELQRRYVRRFVDKV